MNGAIAELCATIIKMPNNSSTVIIGTIHQRLLPQKNPNNSPAIPKRRPVVFMKLMVSSLCNSMRFACKTRRYQATLSPYTAYVFC